jgi:5'-3' exonuclease
MKEKYIIFDGNNIAHIAFHRASSIILKNKKEEFEASKQKDIKLEESDYESVEGMMYLVFLRKIHKIFKKYPNGRYIFAWDNIRSSDWRKSIYSDYKSNRNYEHDPIWQVLFKGMSELKSVLEYYPIYQVSIENLEGDDIIYVYSKYLSRSSDVVIVSGDSDLVQIAQTFPNTKIYHPLKGKNVEIPEDYLVVHAKAIKGEKGDGIPGLPGYGDVKSQRLAREIKENPDAIDKLNEEQQSIFLRNIKLIDISKCPNLDKVYFDLEAVDNATNTIDLDKIKSFYFNKKLKSLLESFDSIASIFAR